MEIVWKFHESGMDNFASPSVEDHHSRFFSSGERSLSDKILGKVVIKIRGAHDYELIKKGASLVIFFRS
jgi:hypothetical protein